MPSLVAFGRKWNIGSDDFVFPEITEAFVRISWVVFGVCVFVFHFPLSCSSQNFNLHLLVLLIINIVTILLALLTSVLSARGRIMDPNARKAVPFLLHLRLPIFITEIVWTVVATVHAGRSTMGDAGCHFSTLVWITIALEWALILVGVIGIIFVFNLTDEEIEDNQRVSSSSWSRRLRIFKIGQDNLMREAIDELALLLSSFFVDYDLVLSDAVAGLLLVYHSPNNQYSPIIEVVPENKPAWMTLKEAEYYFHHATCVYGWPTYLLYNFNIHSIFRLSRRLQFCGEWRCAQGKSMIIEDNCCYCNTAAVILANERRNVDLVLMSYRNRLYEVPFTVIADHERRAVVISIRGSCSLIDLVTDLCLEDEAMSVDVDQDATLQMDDSLDRRGDVRVHRGMLRSARYIFEILEKHKVLEDVFVVNPGYQLVVTGHSLGAGVGSLLTWLLKQEYPDIKCFAFSPPGCVISEYGQDEMEKYVMSVVSGDDIISRMSYQSLKKLFDKVFAELVACQREKYKILIRGVYQLFFKYPWEDEGLGGHTGLNAGSDPEAAILFRRQNYGCIDDPSLPRRMQLYAPGRIVYLSENEGVTKHQWIDPKCLNDIKLSVSVFSDHMIASVQRFLKNAIDASCASEADIPKVERENAARIAESKIGCPYNDLFSPDLRNSDNVESYYCSQIITEAFKSSNIPWPSHSLNFNDSHGNLIEYWREYFEKRGRKVPQGVEGSHPAQLRKCRLLTIVMRILPGTINLKSLKDSRIIEASNWVGGQVVQLSSGKSFDLIEPRSGKTLSKWEFANCSQVDSVVKLAKKAQLSWASSTWMERSNVLRRAAQLLQIHCDEIAYWESVDNGKPIYEAKADVLSCVDTFTFYSGVAQNLLGKHVPLDSARYAYTKRVPVGVVASIGAWNYPIQTCSWKTAPALACGNAVIYKPSPLSPVSPVILGAVLKEAGLPDGVYNVIQGDAETAQTLLEHELVSKVSFTGSIPTGKKIMKACAERNIKPVTLELGGKSSIIIFDDSDIDTAVSCAMMANFYSQGQVCSNASKVLVQKKILDEFTRKLVEKTKKMKVGDPLEESTKVGAHISAEHRNKVEAYIAEAIGEGAVKLCGGERISVTGLENGFYLSPCILSNITRNMRVYNEEIFGSVLLIIPFDTEEEAIELANDTKMGLAAGIVTRSLAKTARVVDRLNAGNVYVNTYNDVSPFVPFGGMGESGFGRENGTSVLEHYTQIKSVFVNTENCDNPF
ncbi:unnamed protein product [Caenorhabditis bovis]|uniref:Aldehyde dehydrogenase domain-containing protein n=1 Tax=Caenorhabditis bovis TaxID=2654633 RepID=A0A8S1EZU1_9PELO|nr:unnamed protein product [Caenorhabditis bovis]